jgi:hypothetical protein
MKLDFCVSHNYTQRENKMQEKTGHAQNILPVMTTSGHVTNVTSGQKGPTRACIAHLPVADAQNILPDRERD